VEQRRQFDTTETATAEQRSLLRGAIVVLAVLMLLVLVFPTGLANWVDDACFGNWFCDGVSAGLRSVEDFWVSVGFADLRDGLGGWLRDVFQIPEA
jgi:hypothetical protein